MTEIEQAVVIGVIFTTIVILVAYATGFIGWVSV
jgi:hypothetical protein